MAVISVFQWRLCIEAFKVEGILQNPFLFLQVGLIAARRTGRLRGTKQITAKSDKE